MQRTVVQSCRIGRLPDSERDWKLTGLKGFLMVAEPCVAMGMALQNGACRDYNEDVSGNNNYIEGTSCASLQQAVASRRPPSDRSFTSP